MIRSLEGKLALGMIAVVALAIAVTVLLVRWSGLPVLAAVVTFAVAVPAAMLCAHRFVRPVVRTIQAVADGIGSMKDGDFSVSVHALSQDELGDLVRSYNGLGDRLRTERQTLYQRELLLDTVIQSTPLAIVLTNATGRVVYGNLAARHQFLGGRKLEGISFTELLDAAPEPLRVAVAARADTLFTIENSSEPETYFVSQRVFLLNSQSHTMYLLKQLTRELGREEVKTWKKVIRVIAHELNNSLAPISSLAHSGKLIAAAPQPAQLERIFSTIEERARHLHTFIDGYASFAKLPQPRLRSMAWSEFLSMLQQTTPFRMGQVPDSVASFDPIQMEQVLINLLKNAREAGASEDSIEIDVVERSGGFLIQVRDGGCGMSEELLHNALLPFYSTKASGAGLGLTLCREVIEAHGGRISLANRPEGGLVVSLWLLNRLETMSALEPCSGL